MTIARSFVLSFALLFEEFRAASWAAWRGILARVTPAVREIYVAAGRGSGKSRIVAVIACAYAAREYRRAAGESIYIGIFAPDKKQAGVTFRYVVGLMRSVPELAALIEQVKQGSVELSNGVIVEVITASTAAPRGRTYALAIVEEAAFLPSDGTANPDKELVRSLRPALARCPGSLLCVVSSPYARRGILWDAKRKAEKKADPRVLFIQEDTATLNPTFDVEEIARAYEDDPVAASAEYGAEFRSDIETFVTRDAVEACVVTGRLEIAPAPDISYTAFCDPSGGRSDSFTLALGHVEAQDGQPVAVLDLLRERTPPFSPENAVAEFAAVLKAYRLLTVTGDRYAGEWPVESFKRHGIEYVQAAKPKSDLYRDALALINGQRVELLDSQKLITQIVSLERRTARGGKDSIDHPPNAHDDLANAALGLAVSVALTIPRSTSATWGRDLPAERPATSTTPKRIVRKIAGRWQTVDADDFSEETAHEAALSWRQQVVDYVSGQLNRDDV